MGIPIGGSGGIAFGGGNIPLPEPTVPVGLVPLVYPDTIRVYAQTDDQEADPKSTPYVEMPARIEGALAHTVEAAGPEGVERISVFTPDNPGILEARQTIEVVANIDGPLVPTFTLVSVGRALFRTQPTPEWKCFAQLYS